MNIPTSCVIETQGLTKTYKGIQALKALDVKVARNSICGFLGPNGAGKTTTIKMLGGVLAPTSGSVAVCGIDLQAEPERAKRKIGFIPDRPYLYEKLTGLEFLRFTADIYGVPVSEFPPKAAAALEMFALADWSNELIESYSHGMKQRLIMASAVLHDPEVLIVDEPMVGLDPLAIIMVKKLFRKLAADGVTIFMSTHTLKVAEDICDRIGIITRGRLIANGTAADLRREAEGTRRQRTAADDALNETQSAARRIRKPQPGDNPIYARMIKRLAFLQDRSPLPLRLVNVASPMVTASMIWNYTDLMLALFQYPGEVHALLEVITEATIDYVRLQLTHIKHLCTMGHEPEVLPPEIGLRVSEEQEREGLDIGSHGEAAYDH